MAFLLALLLLLGDGPRTLSPAIPFEDVSDDYDGQWITVRITLNTSEDILDGKTSYGCVSDDEVGPVVVPGN